MDILERVRQSLSQVSLGNNNGPNQANIEVSTTIGADLLHSYETHQSIIQSNSQSINRSGKAALQQTQQSVDQALKYNEEWQRFRVELDTMPSIAQSINQLSAKVAEVGAKIDRLDRALALVIEAREKHLSSQYQAKKDAQLDRQRENNKQALLALKAALEAQTRHEAAIYQSINQVPPPLIESQPIPNRPASTLYGAADLGQIPTVQVKRVSRKSVNQPINQASTGSPTSLSAHLRKGSAPIDNQVTVTETVVVTETAAVVQPASLTSESDAKEVNSSA
jgi:hypothetical protein